MQQQDGINLGRPLLDLQGRQTRRLRINDNVGRTDLELLEFHEPQPLFSETSIIRHRKKKNYV